MTRIFHDRSEGHFNPTVHRTGYVRPGTLNAD